MVCHLCTKISGIQFCHVAMLFGEDVRPVAGIVGVWGENVALFREAAVQPTMGTSVDALWCFALPTTTSC